MRKNNRLTYWAGALLVSIGFFAELMLFDRMCHIERNSMWLTVLYNAIPALLAGGLCMLSRSKKGFVAIAACALTVCTIWLISNYMYYRANGLFVTWQVAQMAGRLKGFESSILACWNWKLSVLILISLGCITGTVLLPHRQQRSRGLAVIGAVILLYFATVPIKYMNRRNPNNRFGAEWLSLTSVPKGEGDLCSMEYTEHIYMKMHSAMTYFLTFCKDAVVPKAELHLTDDDYARMQSLIGERGHEKAPEGHLLYVLVESMEGWIMETADAQGEPICRNILRWAESRPAIRSNGVISQKVYGESGDGQLICSTGVLPIDEGLTCNLYGSNEYPNFAHFYGQSAVISPTTYMYNRSVTTYSYGFKELIEPQKETPWWDDHAVVDSTIAYLSRQHEPACVMALTVDSHMPFTGHRADVDLADSIEGLEADYIRSFRHVDNELGRLLQWADTAACMQNATVVITGDHYTWYDGFSSRPRCCPLVMSGPGITENIWAEEMYQMDIWTTLMDVLGQTDYYWQGLGASALRTDMSDTPEKQPGRPHSWQESLYISNLLIRTNYFAEK